MRDKILKQQRCFEAALGAGITIEAAAAAAASLYGACAKTAVAWCAIHARSDGRRGDFGFWVRVFRHLGDDG
ncbi:hypothetical protein AB3480_25105 [Rhizobium mongolense]|uniref:hypothetical protein n=1 Tax=Rhizobium mongolense TaxID=57676 RepID=UPI0034A25AC7